MKKKILIIGSSGYIGGNLRKKIINKKNLKNFFFFIFSHKINGERKFNFFNIKSLESFFVKHKPDFVLNLTGQIGLSENFKKKTLIANHNLIKICNKKKIKIFLASSDHVYNNGERKNNNNSITKPKTDYGRFKKKIESLYFKFCNDFLILRISNVYDSKFEKKGLLRNLILAKSNNSKLKIQNTQITRNFIHINDLIDLIFLIFTYNNHLPKVINISHENFKIADLLKILFTKSLKKKLIINLKAKDQKSIKICCNFIFKNLKYKYKHNLKKNLKHYKFHDKYF